MKKHSWRALAALLIVHCLLGALHAQPATEPLLIDTGDASLRNWVQPAYPDAAKKAKLEGDVLVEYVVGVDGLVSEEQVVESTDPVFNAAALAAVKQWTFAPAVDGGKPVASAMRVRVEFGLAQLKQKRVPIAPGRQDLMPVGLRLTPAKPKRAPDPDYPPELEDRKLAGEVRMEFAVETDGRPREPRVLWASHAAFVEMALRAVEKTEFIPAHQGSVNKPTTIQYPVVFDSFGAKRRDILDANRLAVAGDVVPDTLPEPVVLIEPVYPLEKFLAGKTGTAEIDFTISSKGYVEDVVLVSASEPDYGAAATAAVEAWLFRPALTGGNHVAVRMKVSCEFAPASDGNTARLFAALQPDGAGIPGPSGLDQRLKPLWRGFPVYPAALKGERLEGNAEIEFVIDQGGRARLPRVLSASREEFGWAAATAISQWVFERPLRAGEPVDVRVRIPVGFAPPKS
jgi:TonB family protein